MIGALIALALAGPATIADLGWMSGRWESETGDRWTEEQWSEPRGGVMLGFGRSGSDDALREWEQIRLAPGEGGVPIYFASPRGGTAVAFRLVRLEGTSATFENPDHDFPQRIRYVRTGDTLVATISAIDGSNAVSWTFRRRH